MSTAQRSALIVVSVLVLAIGFVVAQGGDDAETPTTTAAAATATSTATTAAPAAPAPATTTTTAAAPAPKPRPKPAPPTVRVEGGQPAGGVKRLTFDKGETVRFRVASDVADEVHVHGYDVSKDVDAGGRVSFSFKGDIDGIFEVELENAGVQIASLRVG